jgi:transposase InsO family protein
MPWKETSVLEERMRFMAAWKTGHWEMAALCRNFGISRKTGYKLVERFEAEGVDGLKDRSRAPHRCPHMVDELTVQKVLRARRRWGWGPKKLLGVLQEEYPDLSLPARSTIGEILKRHGLTAPRRRRRHVTPYQQPFVGISQPNDVWSADFKGHFRLGNGSRCHPLTLTDNFSRFLLRCQGLTQESMEQSRPVFEAAFREYGLPLAIRTDNGPPFAATGLAGLSRLSVWLIKLGIVPERIDVGHPEQNGRHERMHLTLKIAATQPASHSLRAQQRRLNQFREEFNNIRPHEALGMKTPAAIYRPSARSMPAKVPRPEYDEDAVRKVSPCGIVCFDKRAFFVSGALAGEHVGLRPYRIDGVWVIRFAFMDLALIDLRRPGHYLRIDPLPPELSWRAAVRLQPQPQAPSSTPPPAAGEAASGSTSPSQTLAAPPDLGGEGCYPCSWTPFPMSPDVLPMFPD